MTLPGPGVPELHLLKALALDDDIVTGRKSKEQQAPPQVPQSTSNASKAAINKAQPGSSTEIEEDTSGDVQQESQQGAIQDSVAIKKELVEKQRAAYLAEYQRHEKEHMDTDKEPMKQKPAADATKSTNTHSKVVSGVYTAATRQSKGPNAMALKPPEMVPSTTAHTSPRRERTSEERLMGRKARLEKLREKCQTTNQVNGGTLGTGKPTEDQALTAIRLQKIEEHEACLRDAQLWKVKVEENMGKNMALAVEFAVYYDLPSLTTLDRYGTAQNTRLRYAEFREKLIAALQPEVALKCAIYKQYEKNFHKPTTNPPMSYYASSRPLLRRQIDLDDHVTPMLRALYSEIGCEAIYPDDFGTFVDWLGVGTLIRLFIEDDLGTSVRSAIRILFSNRAFNYGGLHMMTPPSSYAALRQMGVPERIMYSELDKDAETP